MVNKICVILPCNLYVAPFFYKYEKILLENYASFDLVMWNRVNIVEQCSASIISYNKKIKSNDGNILKIFAFISFGRFVKKKISEKKYDKIIILGSYSGTMAYLSKYLTKKYKQNYWLDIRDYTYEWSKYYRKMMSRVISNSYKTVISSPGYSKFLPFHDYLTAHNFDSININKVLSTEHSLDREGRKIRISFIGNVRYIEENLKLLSVFKNDQRFILQYFGDGSKVLEEYCKFNMITNSRFIGRFSPEQTADLYNKTDIINNVYGNKNIALSTAISNKYYFSLALKLPILVSKGTYMETITSQVGIGFTVDFSDVNLKDNLYTWFWNLDRNKVGKKCETILEQVIKDENTFKDALVNYIKKKL